MPELECPRCHTRTDFELLGRDVRSFCPVCDYPMFFAGEAEETVLAGATSAAGGDEYRRRLPGAAGMAGVASVACWFCGERNVETQRLCTRCGTDLSAAPVAVETKVEEEAEEEKKDEEPPPEPQVEPSHLPLWRLVALFLLLIALVWVAVALATSEAETAASPCPDVRLSPFVSRGSVSGRAVDGLTGEGVGAATVTLDGPAGTLTAETTTVATPEVAAGSYVFCDLPSGGYTVSFSAPDYHDAVIPVTLDSEAMDITVDGRLEVIPTALRGRVVVVAGTTAQPHRQPVSGLELLFDPTPEDPDNAPIHVGVTDDTGAFSISVPATRGEHSLIFGGDFLVDETELSVVPGTAVDVGEITLVRVFALSGSLGDEFGRSFNEIADLFDPPLAGEAGIEVVSLRAALDAFAIDTSDPAYDRSFSVRDGFVLDRLPGPATYTLAVTLPDGLDRFTTTATATVELDGDEPAIELTVPFAPGVVWGTVATTDTVAPRMEVNLIAVDNANLIATERTDGAGRITFGPLPSAVDMVAALRRDQAGLLGCAPVIAYSDVTSSVAFGQVVCSEDAGTLDDLVTTS